MMWGPLKGSIVGKSSVHCITRRMFLRSIYAKKNPNPALVWSETLLTHEQWRRIGSSRWAAWRNNVNVMENQP